MLPDQKSIHLHYIHKPINQIDYKLEELKEYACKQIDEGNISQSSNVQGHFLSNRSFKREFATTSPSYSKIIENQTPTQFSCETFSSSYKYITHSAHDHSIETIKKAAPSKFSTGISSHNLNERKRRQNLARDLSNQLSCPISTELNTANIPKFSLSVNTNCFLVLQQNNDTNDPSALPETDFFSDQWLFADPHTAPPAKLRAKLNTLAGLVAHTVWLERTTAHQRSPQPPNHPLQHALSRRIF